jgi:hypothetical protein
MADQDPAPRPHPPLGLGYALAALALWAAVLLGGLLSSQAFAPSAHRGAGRRHLAERVSCAHGAPVSASSL